MEHVMDEISSTQVSSAMPTQIITWLGIIAGVATALVTALATIDGVPTAVTAAVGAIAAVSTAVFGVLTKQSVTRQTTPWTDVAAKVTPSGRIISGPADPDRPTGASVALVDAGTPPSFQPGATVYPEGDGDTP